MQNELPRIHMLVAISSWGTNPFLPSIPSIPSFLFFETMHYIVSCFNNWTVYIKPKSTTRGRFQLSVKLMKKRITIFTVCVFLFGAMKGRCQLCGRHWKVDLNARIPMLKYLSTTYKNKFVCCGLLQWGEDFVPWCYHIQGQTPPMLSPLWKSPIELHGTLFGCGLRWAT